jgi:predicted MPP superfamily phosphohydrolase
MTSSVSDGKVHHLRIAVLSDLHAFSNDALSTPPSHLPTFRDDLSPTQHPIKGLSDVIANLGEINLFLCPGDITYQADRGGIDYAWKALNSLASEYAAPLFIVSGNHDVDSRGRTNSYDPTEHLKNISPPFPTPDTETNDRYWARNYTFVESENYQILLLNSCAYHHSEAERGKGRISLATIEKICKELENRKTKPFNILLCHHHPQAHSDIEDEEYDVMTNGFRLLERLANYGNWVVVHGHKHHPKISYAAGGATSPIVFSAASFSSVLYAALQTRTKNQFYCLNLEWRADASLINGEVLAWNWSAGRGWVRPDGLDGGLAARSGFGCRAHPQELSKKIANSFEGEFVTWASILQSVPELNYLIPQDYVLLKTFLVKDYGLSIVEHMGQPYQIGTKK